MLSKVQKLNGLFSVSCCLWLIKLECRRNWDITKAHTNGLENHKEERCDDNYKRLGKMIPRTRKTRWQNKWKEIITRLGLLFFVIITSFSQSKWLPNSIYIFEDVFVHNSPWISARSFKQAHFCVRDVQALLT